MGCDMVVLRYVIYPSIPCVDELSTGPLGFGASQLVHQNIGIRLPRV